MEVLIADTYDEMSIRAARAVGEFIDTKPNAVLGMAAGSTPLGLYRELVRLHRNEGLDFTQVTTFNLDEYAGLHRDDPHSFHRFMHEHFFQHVNIPTESIHIPSGTASDNAASCAWYEERIQECGGIDIQILGIGSDGHIAFNEPGSSLSSRTRLKTLARQTIKDNARFFERPEDVPMYAITMGVGTILEARTIFMLASGETKAAAIAQAIEGPVTSMITASALQLHPSVRVFLDGDAASELQMKDYWSWVQENNPRQEQ